MSTGKKILIGIGIALIVLIIGVYSTIKGYYNTFVTMDEGVKASWAQVENQYQRRYDLIPNLVETVKGYAKHEKETFQAVTEARSKMGGVVQLSAEAVKDPAVMAKFQQAQAGLGSALQRLMVVAERYPDLKANRNFSELQAQLEGTENRIAVERRRYNETVMAYNIAIRKFPANIFAGMFGFSTAQVFQADEASKKAPEVKF